MSIHDAEARIIKYLREATTEKVAAEAAWKRAIKQANRDGLDKTKIAREAGVSRKTIYAILSTRKSTSYQMNQALSILAAADTTGQAGAGLATSDLLAKARRVQILAKSIVPGSLTEEELRTIGDGNRAAAWVLTRSDWAADDLKYADLPGSEDPEA